MSTTTETYATAIHEAAHAVVGLSKKIPVRRVSIANDGCGVWHWGPIKRQSLFDLAVACLSAWEAEKKICPETPIDNSLGDYRTATGIFANCLSGTTIVECCTQEARTAVNLHWKAITALADLLVERQSLTGAEVESLVRPYLDRAYR